MNKKPLTTEAGEVQELTAEDFRQGLPAAKALPELLGPELAQSLLKSGPTRKPARAG